MCLEATLVATKPHPKTCPARQVIPARLDLHDREVVCDCKIECRWCHSSWKALVSTIIPYLEQQVSWLARTEWSICLAIMLLCLGQVAQRPGTQCATGRGATSGARCGWNQSAGYRLGESLAERPPNGRQMLCRHGYRRDRSQLRRLRRDGCRWRPAPEIPEAVAFIY